MSGFFIQQLIDEAVPYLTAYFDYLDALQEQQPIPQVLNHDTDPEDESDGENDLRQISSVC
jgi:hypothetical protein